MAYYLGIDGGGTKTTCGIAEDSRLLATTVAGGSNIIRSGQAHARESLQRAVREACAAAGIAPGQIASACAGGSGAGRAEVAELVRGFLAEILSCPIEVVGDIQIALEAAFGSGPGVIVIAGTGSSAYGRNALGETGRAGGWGFAIGDEGSAHWIGRSAVNAVLRASDLKLETTNDPANPESLAAALFKCWGVTSFLDLARAANSIPPPDFAVLSAAVMRSNDALAVRVLSDAGRELAGIAEIVIRKLFSDRGCAVVPVAMTGGVFGHSEIVRQVFYNELRKLDARVEINQQVIDPVEGALRMARRAPKRS